MAKQLLKTIRLPLVMLIVLTILLGACASAQSEPMMAYDEAGGAPLVERAVEAPAALEPEFAEEEANLSKSTYDGESADRIVIKNASMTLVVDDPGVSMDNIARLAEEMGGFVVNANMYQQFLQNGLQVPRASITIRVPAEKLNETLDLIKAESDQEPQSAGINSQDVTSDYVDLQSRLRNLEATEAQLTAIMEDARKTEDVLAVYNELVRVREQIEVIKGQIKYYEESAALSSVSIELIANEAAQPLTIAGWQPEGVAKRAVQTLIDTMQFIVNAVIWIILYVLPVLLVLYLVFFLPISLVWKRWRKRRKQRKENAKEETPEEEESQAEGE
jgi:hypothetical protein